MTNAFTKAQFMEPPSGATGPVPLGAVKAGNGITITPDGTISTTNAGGTVTDIVATNGLQGGGQGPQVFLGLLPPAGTTIGGVKTLAGSGISIDSEGVIRNLNNTTIVSSLGLNVTNFGAGAFEINLRSAGTGLSLLGGVFVPSGSGLVLGPTGSLSVAPATNSTLGGVKPGTGLTVSPDGTLNTSDAGGTITGVGVGTGLGGGGISGAVTLFLVPPTPTVIGGVKQGTGLTISVDGTISVNATPASLPLTGGTLTGALFLNTGGTAGSSALTVSGGSLVLSTTFTPANSSASGVTGKIAWDNSYLYICTAPNTWGRIAIDSTPF
jgi:hypothetical protein